MSTLVALDVMPVPLDPGNPVELIPGGGAFVGLFVVVFIGIIAVGIWRMTVVNSASKQLGLTDEQRILAVTDENAGAAIVTGAIIADAVTGRREASGGTAGTDETGAADDLATRLASLQTARDRGLISPEEFATARQRILDEV